MRFVKKILFISILLSVANCVSASDKFSDSFKKNASFVFHFSLAGFSNMLFFKNSYALAEYEIAKNIFYSSSGRKLLCKATASGFVLSYSFKELMSLMYNHDRPRQDQ